MRLFRRLISIFLAAIFGTFSTATSGLCEARTSDTNTQINKNVEVTALALASDLTKADAEAWLDGYLPYALASGDIAGAQVVIVKDGKILTEKGYGYADVANKAVMDTKKTMVRIGSTSKLFTWTAVMQQVELGRIDLNVDVNRYLDFKISGKGGKPITMRDLMNHRTGFEEGLKDILSVNPTTVESTEHYLKTHIRPTLFEPGALPAYSNYGAALAGYIVERVSGEPYDAYIEHHILAPLKMTRTSFYAPLQTNFIPMVSKGYFTAKLAPEPYEQVVTRPAGSGTATGADMARFMLAQLGNGELDGQKILNPETMQLMHSPSIAALPGFSTMAHGFIVEMRNGRIMLGHGGDTVIFHTDLQLFPQEHVGIFMNFNSRGTNNAVYAVREKLLRDFTDRYFPEEKPIPVIALASARQDALKIAGLYQSSRRIENGFISLFYLLQQNRITANADGTITTPNPFGDDETFTEIAPQLWHQVSGSRELALQVIDGVPTVLDSANPISVLQPVPFVKSSVLNLPILVGSVGIIFLSLLLWSLSKLLLRMDSAQSAITPEVSRLRLRLRLVCLATAVYIGSWIMILQPIISNHVEAYSSELDPVLRILQIFGLVIIVLTLFSAWWVRQLFQCGAPWLQRIGGLLLVIAMLGIVWLGIFGQLMSFTLNY